MEALVGLALGYLGIFLAVMAAVGSAIGTGIAGEAASGVVTEEPTFYPPDHQAFPARKGSTVCRRLFAPGETGCNRHCRPWLAVRLKRPPGFPGRADFRDLPGESGSGRHQYGGKAPRGTGERDHLRSSGGILRHPVLPRLIPVVPADLVGYKDAGVTTITDSILKTPVKRRRRSGKRPGGSGRIACRIYGESGTPAGRDYEPWAKAGGRRENRRKSRQDGCRTGAFGGKNQLVEEVFQAVKKRLAGMKDEDYRQFLRQLILQAVETGDEKLFFSIPDHRWLGEAFLTDLNRELERQGRKGALSYGEAAADLNGGFILRRGKVVQNFSLDNLVEMKKDELLPEVGRRLFTE